MADLPSTDELVAIGRAAFRAAIDPEGTGTVNLRPGSRNDAALGVMAALGTRLANYAAGRAAARLLSSATGDDLDALGVDLYHEKRKAEAFATGQIRLTRGGSSATSIPAGSRFAVPATDTSAAVVFYAPADVPSSATSALVPLTAVESGESGNIGTPAAVTTILDPLPDTTWAIDTGYDDPPASAFGGGAPAESDDTYRARLQQLTPNVSGGTRAALVQGSTRVGGVGEVTPIEPFDGTVILYAGDANHVLPQAMSDAIETGLLDWRAFGLPVLPRTYDAQTVQIVATVHMARSVALYTNEDLRGLCTAAVIDYFARRERPDEYFLNGIESALFAGHPEVQNVVLTTPSVDVPRPTDASYGAITALARYTVSAASIALTFADPQTT